MRSRTWHRAWHALALIFLPCCALAISVTDDRGITVTFERSPQRVVSLLPSLTETVCALDRCQRLVGVDRYSDFPAQVQRLPRLGGGLDPNIEAVVALRPDVVLLAKSSRFIDRLESLSLKVLALEPRTQTDARQVMGKLGTLLDVPDAEKIWQRIDDEVAAAARSLPPSLRGVRVYFEVNDGPYAAGEASFIGEIMSRLGAKNIVPANLGPFPRLNPEFVVQADPDLILLGDRSEAALVQRPGWPQMRAIREKHLCTFTPAQANVLVRPGPRMGEAARLIAACIVARGTRSAEHKR